VGACECVYVSVCVRAKDKHTYRCIHTYTETNPNVILKYACVSLERNSTGAVGESGTSSKISETCVLVCK